jgi:hypothetical protein
VWFIHELRRAGSLAVRTVGKNKHTPTPITPKTNSTGRAVESKLFLCFPPLVVLGLT